MTPGPPSGGDYRRDDVVEALTALGVRDGDLLFTHSSVGILGRPAEGLTKEILAELFLSAFQEVLGASGTWVLPCFTYSYMNEEPFDPASTPPKNMGVLPELLWRLPQAVRSQDPIFSVIAIGARAQELLGDLPSDDCFGEDSIYARLIAADAAVCNIGLGSHAALIHHVEQTLEVPYRYLKYFKGTTVVDGQPRETEVAYNVRDLDQPRHAPYFMRLDRDGRATGATKGAVVGRDEINLIRARDMERLIREGLNRDPEYLVVGDLAGHPVG